MRPPENIQKLLSSNIVEDVVIGIIWCKNNLGTDWCKNNFNYDALHKIGNYPTNNIKEGKYMVFKDCVILIGKYTIQCQDADSRLYKKYTIYDETT